MGNRDKHLLTQLDTIAKGLSETLAPFCEVVVHDLTNPEHAILSIHNNLSGEKLEIRQLSWGWQESCLRSFQTLLQTMLTSLQMVPPCKSTSIGIKDEE